MATAEVRASWQRAVNRCFVPEDAKRAPKLACCQSSCATSKLFDAGAASASDEFDHAAVDVTHFNQNSSFSNVIPDSRWWLLQLQPNYEVQKGLTYEQLNALEDEVENRSPSKLIQQINYPKEWVFVLNYYSVEFFIVYI